MCSLFWLLLVQPVSCAIEKMKSDHMSAGSIAHLVDGTSRFSSR
jgi:hypothetical protein